MNIDTLKAPEGFALEPFHGHPDHFVMRRIDGGWATFDVKRRLFNPGYGDLSGPGVPHTGEPYKGQGWIQRMVNDAAEYLDLTMGEKGETQSD